MKKAILYDVIIENNMNITEDFEEIIQRTLNARPTISPDPENIIDLLLNLQEKAKEFSTNEYTLLFEKGFDVYIQIVKSYINIYLSKEDLKKIELFYKWGLGNENEKEQIKKIYFNSYIINQFKFIRIDADLFINFDYFNIENKNKNFQIWENFLNKIEFDNLEDYKRLYYFYQIKIHGFDNKIAMENAPKKIQYKDTAVKTFVKEGLDIAIKYKLPLPATLKSID